MNVLLVFKTFLFVKVLNALTFSKKDSLTFFILTVVSVVAWSVCLSVCPLVTTVSCAKTAEPIAAISSEMWIHGAPNEPCICWALIPPDNNYTWGVVLVSAQTHGRYSQRYSLGGQKRYDLWLPDYCSNYSTYLQGFFVVESF